MTRLAAVVLALLGLASCGDDEPASPGVEVPPWAKVAPEQIAEAKKHDVPVAFENDLGMRFVLIPVDRQEGSVHSRSRRGCARPPFCRRPATRWRGWNGNQA